MQILNLRIGNSALEHTVQIVIRAVVVNGICPQVAARQAAESGHSAAEEMLLLATHGMLHLLGYDHATDPEREVMFALQRKLLLTFLATR